ncbi:MAG: Flp pilus assembly protein CpaB [Dehalococcoidia bacterium]|nr:Flp pilus assembly protein CpaB [Dehalococcoidia bacterium]
MAHSIPANAPPALGGRKVLIAALILGAVTAGLIVAFLASRDSSSTAPLAVTTLDVVVAKQDIAAGVTVTNDMVELREIPANAAVSGAATNLRSVVGETARYPLLEGEQIAMTRLVEPPKQKSLSFTIPAGLRGFTVPVEITRSPAALLVPGDFVDVIVSAELVHLLPGGLDPNATVGTNNDKPKAAVTLLQNVQVISVQRAFVDSGVPYDESTRGAPRDEENTNYVTLAVTPDQAQILWLATQEGALTLSLRSFGDNVIAELTPVAEPIRLP